MAGADVNFAHAPRGITPLYFAARGGHAAAVELFIAAGADVNMTAPNGYAPLHIAAFRGHVAVVQQLVAAGADVDIAGVNFGTTPLDYAIRNGHTDVARILRTAGAT